MERNNNCIRSSYNSTNLGGSSSSSGTTNIMRELNQQYHRYNHITSTGATTNIHNKVISSICSSSWDLSMLEKYEEDQYLHELSSWPPRSYTCSFCKREFRSAQALGGHMNVHRRDRARLRSVQSPTTTSPTTSTNTTAFNLNLNNNPNPADIISNTDCIHSSFSSSLPPPLQTAAEAAAAALSPRPPASSLASTKQHDHQASPCCRKLPFLDVSSTHYCRPSSYYPQPLSTYRDTPVHQCQQQQQQRGTRNDSVLLDGTLMSRKREQGYDSKMKSCPRSACLGIVGDKCDGALSKKPSLVRLDLEMGVLIDAKDDLDLELRLGFN